MKSKVIKSVADVTAEYFLPEGEVTFSHKRAIKGSGDTAHVVVEGMGVVMFRPNPGQRVFDVVEMLRRVADALDP